MATVLLPRNLLELFPGAEREGGSPAHGRDQRLGDGSDDDRGEDDQGDRQPGDGGQVAPEIADGCLERSHE